MNKIFEILWYDPKSDSTLHRYDWRFHHNGIALLLLFIGIYAGLIFNIDTKLISAISISVLFLIYKIFIQGNFKEKTLTDFLDVISDFTDYSVIWLVIVYPNKILLIIIAMILIIAYSITSRWSKP